MRGKTIARVFPPPGFTAKEVFEKQLRLALQPQEPIFGGPGGGRCIVPCLAQLLEEFIIDPNEFPVLPMAVRVVRLEGQQVAVGLQIEPFLTQHFGYHGSARAVHSRDTNGHRRLPCFRPKNRAGADGACSPVRSIRSVSSVKNKTSFPKGTLFVTTLSILSRREPFRQLSIFRSSDRNGT